MNNITDEDEDNMYVVSYSEFDKFLDLLDNPPVYKPRLKALLSRVNIFSKDK